MKTCNFHIRNLYMITYFVNRKDLVTLVQPLIISKVDYCNSLFIGLPMSSWRRFSLSWIEQQGLYSTCPKGFQPPPHLLSCIGCLPRQELNLQYVSLLLKLSSLTSRPILGNFCLFPPMNPPWVWEVQMTLTVYMKPRAIGERGFANRSFSYIAPRLYKLPIMIKLIDSLNTFKSHLNSLTTGLVHAK